MTTQWEYKVQTYKLGWKGFDYHQIEQDLNELASQGWEVLNTIAPSYGQGQAMEIAIFLKKTSA